MISTKNLDRLPEIEDFIRITQSLAALDAILSSDWEYRYYSFDSKWSDNQQMASMRDGSGDQWFSVISKQGVALLGLAHESPQYTPDNPKPWVYDQLPPEFDKNLRREPAFDSENSTLCIWRLASDSKWSSGITTESSLTDDGSEQLLTILEGRPNQYAEYAAEYYERTVAVELIQSVYDHKPITRMMAASINPDVVMDPLKKDLVQIGYPCTLE